MTGDCSALTFTVPLHEGVTRSVAALAQIEWIIDYHGLDTGEVHAIANWLYNMCEIRDREEGQ